mgnify:CR=1 FL=1
MAKSFKEMAKKDEGTYLIVDALNLAFRYKHSKKRNFAEDYISPGYAGTNYTF